MRTEEEIQEVLDLFMNTKRGVLNDPKNTFRDGCIIGKWLGLLWVVSTGSEIMRVDYTHEGWRCLMDETNKELRENLEKRDPHFFDRLFDRLSGLDSEDDPA